MPTIDEQLREHLQELCDWQPTDLRLAAVLFALVAHQGKDHVLFVMRHEGTHRHAGQLAFPGGMRDADESPLQTALRETREEVAAPAEAIHVLGWLPPRISSSGILVHCAVARLAPIELVRDEREVARILHIPLDKLRDDARWADKPPPPKYLRSGKQPRTSPHFEHGDDLLWGLTARFVRDLLAPGHSAEVR